MILKPLRAVVVCCSILSVIVLSSCWDTPGSEQITGNSNLTATGEEDFTADDTELKVGTIIGTPSDGIQKNLKFVLGTVDEINEVVEDEEGVKSVKLNTQTLTQTISQGKVKGETVILTSSKKLANDYPSYCTKEKIDTQQAEGPQGTISALDVKYVQVCKATPSSLKLAIRGVDFVQCTNADGVAVVCNPQNASLTKSRFSLYSLADDDAAILSVADEEVVFPHDLKSLTESLAIGGVEFKIDYMQYSLPTLSQQTVEAEKFTKELQGASYRICTTSENAELCSEVAPEYLDAVFDLNHDDLYGYLAGNSASLYEVANKSSVDNKLDLFTQSLLDNSSIIADTILTSWIEVDDVNTATIILPTDHVYELDESASYDMSVYLDITDTFIFLDNIRAVYMSVLGGVNSPSLLLSAEVTSSNQKGIFHPYHDWWLPQPPGVELLFERL